MRRRQDSRTIRLLRGARCGRMAQARECRGVRKMEWKGIPYFSIAPAHIACA